MEKLSNTDFIELLNNPDCDKCPNAEECINEIGVPCALFDEAARRLEGLTELLYVLTDNLPCCIGCEGKTVFGERTDKCVYEDDGPDGKIFCSKRGVEQLMRLFDKERTLEELTRPGRWIYWRNENGIKRCKCSLCLTSYGCLDTPFCPNCGHPMVDEELRTCYCPICDKHFEIHSNDSGGSCPDCGHHVVLHKVEVAE